MIPATAVLRARQTFGAVGYHQIHPLDHIKRLIDSHTEYSVLTASGFKHITLLEPQGNEPLYTLTISVLGKRHEISAVASQRYYDFNKGEIRSLLELTPSESGILFNTSADVRCNGVNVKLQLAEVLDITPTSHVVDVFNLQLQQLDARVFIDDLESAL